MALRAWADGVLAETSDRHGIVVSQVAAALTPAEPRVARLAAAGQSNPEIVARLVVAEKTVQFHLTNAYRKLGIASRAELAAALEIPVG